MKTSRFKPFRFVRMDAHAAWLAGMARQGWHYLGQNAWGLQRFEQAAPADMAFTWDLAPRKEEELLAYCQRCREAGWELAGTAGRWHCWRQPVVAGQAVLPLRDREGKRAMLRELQGRFGSSIMLGVVVLFLCLPRLSRPDGPGWFFPAYFIGMLAFMGIMVPNKLHAMSRLRQLDANGPG
ncbi:DUF2812 domain-containing protein [Pseudoduganella sp. OTU4001]|uniref:DUF2812 domain-containing protein n=1 Tax=Pseudoduganella sp. OTU4001 TaxID=3043854 RepID=UPI00313D7603